MCICVCTCIHIIVYVYVYGHVYAHATQNLIFLGLNFVTNSLDSSFVKNHLLGPSGGYPFWARFSFFFFSPVFFVLFLAFFFFHFSHFLVISSFKCFSLSFFIFSKDKSFFFSFIVFLSNIFYCWHHCQSLTVSFVVGAPWRCGVLTT